MDKEKNREKNKVLFTLVIIITCGIIIFTVFKLFYFFDHIPEVGVIGEKEIDKGKIIMQFSIRMFVYIVLLVAGIFGLVKNKSY